MQQLQPCPFCGSPAKNCGGSMGGVTVRLVRCSNDVCLASYKSVDPKVWNTRPGDNTSEKLSKLANEIGVEITLDRLIDAYKTIRADRVREEKVRRAEYDAIRARVAEQTAEECKKNGWFSVERLRVMTLGEISELLGGE